MTSLTLYERGLHVVGLDLDLVRLVHCRQLILKLIEVICGNCLNAIKQCVSCSKIFLRAGNNPVVFGNSTEYAESLFIALFVIHEHSATNRQ